MSRDLRATLEHAAGSPTVPGDLQDAWRRGRLRRIAKRAAATLGAAAGLVGLVLAGPLRPVADAPVVTSDLPAPPPRAVVEVAVEEPVRVAAVSGRVWVGGYDTVIQPVDAAAGSVGPEVPLDASGELCGLFGGGSTLVAVLCAGPSNPGSSWLVAVRPTDGTERWRSQVSGSVRSVVGSDGELVVLLQDRGEGVVERRDASTGEVTGRLRLPRTSVWDATAAEGRTWVTLTRQPRTDSLQTVTELARLRDRPLGIAERHELPGITTPAGPQAAPDVAATTSGHLVVTLPATGSLSVRGPAGDEVTTVALDATPTHVVADGPLAWIVTRTAVLRVDPAASDVTGAVPLPDIRSVGVPTAADGTLWLPDRSGDRLVGIR